MLKVKKEYSFSKIGLDEVIGLKDAMSEVVKPIVVKLKESIYWDSKLCFEASEYKSRDGFIPYESNCGGMAITTIIPKCEESSFSFLEFGECDDADCDHDSGCSYDDDGHLDAKLLIWLKFEGLDLQTGVMSFYLVLSGGNEDAPYFREKYSETIFESEFTATSIAVFKKKAKSEIAKLLKAMV